MDKKGNIVIGDTNNHRIVVYCWDGKKEKLLGSFGKKGSSEGEFNWPYGVVVDSNNRILVADLGNHRIEIVDVNEMRRDRIIFLCCLFEELE